VSTVFLGIDFAREKFTHRTRGWRRVSSYNDRQILRSGESLDVVRYEVPARFPENKGKKIVWFSDLHFGGKWEIEDKVLEESLEFIKDIDPEYIIYGGDVVSYSSTLPVVRTFLKSLPAKAKKMAILGNWEYSKKWLNEKDWEKFFESSGFELLVNKDFESDDFFFYGTDDLRKGKPVKPQDIPGDKEVVFLSHSPDAFIHISSNKLLERTSLVLSGHTHGGQIRLPFIGALLTSSRYWRRFAYGHFVNSKKANMIVSAGLGCSTIPLRISCRRELVLVDFI
jgi:uncharacterized protein